MGLGNDVLSSVWRISGPARTPTRGILLYEHSNYRGRHKHIIDNDEPNLHADGWGDRISSIQVISGHWKIHQHTNYGGWSMLLWPGNYPNISEVGIARNDSISSVRRFTGIMPDFDDPQQTVETILFQHNNYRGDHKHLINRGEANLHADGWGDRVSSMIVVAGNLWTFHRHVNYGGANVRRAVGSYRNSSAIGLQNDSMSSVRANTIPVAVYSVRSSAPQVGRDFNVANNVFNQYNIGVQRLITMPFRTARANALTDLLYPPGTCVFNLPNIPAEVDELYDVGRWAFPSNIICYYVRSISSGIRGCGGWPAGRPGFVVANNETQFTFAHELGHVMGLPHFTGANANANLMRNGTAGITVATPVLTNAQLTTVRNSALYV
jgi:hypothetical protein